jgi:hypothetical protein
MSLAVPGRDSQPPRKHFAALPFPSRNAFQGRPDILYRAFVQEQILSQRKIGMKVSSHSTVMDLQTFKSEAERGGMDEQQSNLRGVLSRCA